MRLSTAWRHRILFSFAVDRFHRVRENATGSIEREAEQRWREECYTGDVASMVERAETRQELKDALVRLPIIYRTIVVLHDAEGMTVEQRADIQSVGLPRPKRGYAGVG